MMYSNDLRDFSYRITGFGWAELLIVTDKGKVEARISYACDPLPRLLVALRKLHTGETRFESITLDAENCSHDILLTELDGGTLRIEIFEDAYFEIFEPDDDTRIPIPVLTIYTRSLYAARFIIDSLYKMLHSIGESGYNDSWDGRGVFPMQEFIELNNALRAY